MTSLRVLTYNVWFIHSEVYSTPYDLTKRPVQIAQLIIKSPFDYDIVCINEYFPQTQTYDDELRHGQPFVAKLKEKYGHAYVVPPQNDPLDSGLAIFSKWEITQTRFKEFDTPFDLGDEENYAAKGVAFARIKKSENEYVNVLFTHTHSESAEIRSHEFLAVQALYNEVKIDFKIPESEFFLVLGDLNINGTWPVFDESGNNIVTLSMENRQMGDEWNETFKIFKPLSPFKDLWYETSSRADIGRTHHGGNRYDYILASHPDNFTEKFQSPEDILVPQHMAIAHDLRLDGQTSLSDHLPLRADFNLSREACMPRWAKPIAMLDIVDEGDPNLMLLPGELDQPGSIQWFLLDVERTSMALSIAVSGDEHLTFDVYSIYDLSIPLPQRSEKLGKGTIKSFILTAPFYIKVYGRTRSATGQFNLSLTRMLGATRQTAIPLLPGEEFQFQLVRDHALTRTWFVIEASEIASTTRQIPMLTFFARDLNSSNSLNMEVLRDQETEAFYISEPLQRSALVAAKQMQELGKFYICINCNFVSDPQITCEVGVNTNLTVLHGFHSAHPKALSMELYCEDETDPEWPGDDDIYISISADSINIWPEDFWRKTMEFDTDNNRRYTALEQHLSDGGVVRFIDELTFQLKEGDDFGDDHSKIYTVKPLRLYNYALERIREPQYNIQAEIGFNYFYSEEHDATRVDGLYKLRYSLSKHAIIPPTA